MHNLTNLPIPTDRNLYFSDQVEQDTISKLTQDIIRINEDDRIVEGMYKLFNLSVTIPPIKIYIDSYGGTVYQILGLVNIIENSKTPIHTIVTGCAMSCGFIMLISGHKRFAHKHSTILYHQVSNGNWGKLDELKDTVKETKRLDNLLKDIILEKTKLTDKKLKSVDSKKMDWYISPKAAIKHGIIDEIL